MGKPLRVLIVEDSEDDARLLLRELRRGGFEPACERVEDADAMSAALGKGTWDAILCDYSLPKFSAPAALRLMKIAGLDLPFILVSGVIGEEKAVEVMKAGAHDFILKDKLARLVPAIERDLAEARVRRERKRAEERAAAAHLRLIDAIESIPASFKLYDADERLVLCNSKAREFFPEIAHLFVAGTRFEDIIRARAEKAAPVAALGRAEEWVRERLDQFRHPGEVIEQQHADGRWTQVFERRTSEGGTVSIRTDISELKQREQELRHAQKMEALGRLAGGIARDFNNLLVPIMGLTEITMAEVPAKSKLRSNLEEVLEACERAAKLVGQILAFIRAEKLERHPIELHRTVSEALALLRSTLPETIELREHIDRHSGSVLASPTEIHQVMMDLGANAADAMGAKGGVLEVTLGMLEVTDELAAGHAALEPGRYVRLRVNDTGCGMDEETIGLIFDPFFTTKEVGKGTGMGLAVVHGIVTSHGGAITVSSEPGRGTTFELYFPPWQGKDHAALSAGGPALEAIENQAPMLARGENTGETGNGAG